MMSEYVRLNKTTKGFGKLITRASLLNSSELNKYLEEDKSSDWYSSLYFYGSEAKDYVEANNGSIAGFHGNAYSDKLVWDLDSKTNPEIAKQDSITLLERLHNEGVNVLDHVKVYFSGNKGFHVELLTSGKFSPEELKSICSNIAEGLTSYDTVIYNTTRLYRLPNTKHNASGLYKIEIPLAELSEISIEEIKNRAAKPSEVTALVRPLEDLTFLNKYKEVKKEKKTIVVNDEGEIDGVRGIETIDWNKMPSGRPKCLYGLSHGVFKSGEGERSFIFYRLANYYKNQGFTKEGCYHFLKSVAELNHKLYPEHDRFSNDELWTNIINQIYSDNYKFKQIPDSSGTSSENEIVKKYCTIFSKVNSKPCCIHSESSKHEIIRIGEISDTFKTFAQNIDQNTIKTGINFFDDNLRIMVGSPTLLVGATGSGKTTLALNVIEHNNKLGLNSMFFSLDMNKNMVYLKLAQKLTKYNQDQILEFYKSRDYKKIEEIRTKISEVYGKTYFDFTKAQTIESIQDRIFDTEQKIGDKIKLVVIDYADRLVSEYSDEYNSSRYNALKTVDVSDNTQTALVVLTQVSRNTGDGSTPLLTKRTSRGAGAWEESCRSQINVWRSFLGKGDKDKIFNSYIAKNTLGQELQGVLHWNGAKAEIRDMSEDELVEYETELKPLEQSEEKNKFSF